MFNIGILDCEPLLGQELMWLMTIYVQETILYVDILYVRILSIKKWSFLCQGINRIYIEYKEYKE